jgi:hypothetical protein
MPKTKVYRLTLHIEDEDFTDRPSGCIVPPSVAIRFGSGQPLVPRRNPRLEGVFDSKTTEAG